MATGVNGPPNIPVLEGRESFQSTKIYSIDYRNPEAFLGSTTLVVGMGNTEAEIALDPSEHGVNSLLPVRGKCNIVPRDLSRTPVQETAMIRNRIPFGL